MDATVRSVELRSTAQDVPDALPPTVEPPMIARFGTSWDMPQRSTTLMFGSSPILVPP